MKKLRDFIPNLALCMSLGLILITYLDGRNPYMKFLTSGTSKIYILILCVCSIISSIICIACLRNKN